MDIFNLIKNALATLLSFAMAYFAPIQNMVFVIFYVFLINCVIGMITGIVAEGEKFSFKKFTRCLFETLMFYLIVVCLYVIGKNMDNMSGAMQVIGGVIYAIIYFTSVNILRNMSKMFPQSKTLSFLYWIVSFEVLKKIPVLKKFHDFDKNDTL